MESPKARVLRVESECEGVWGTSGITSWERVFLSDIKERNPATLTTKQDKIMRQIEDKAFGRADE